MSISQLSRLLPLPDGELKQVLDYAATLSKSEAVEHFQNLLGDSPDAVDFISSFNSRRQDRNSGALQPAASASAIDAVPKSTRGPKKKKASLRTPPPRQVENVGSAPGKAYNKKDVEEDYISRKSSPSPALSAAASSSKPPQNSAPTQPKPRPSAAGHLISDISKSKPKSTPSSRSSTPGPKTKVTISGGTAMRGASTAISDLDAAIRALEISTNPTKGTDDASRRCNCVGARHPLLAAAPNCLNCGKVICVREGLGPCTFCGTPLLSSSEVQSMIQELKVERGRERMAADREAYKKADVSRTPAPFTKPRETSGKMSAAEVKAREHRDRLLGFQAQNARRTTVRDEAADFDVSAAMSVTGGNIWATPEERARELKRQQKIMREMEWNARPDYEKRTQVLSIDIVKGKVLRKMAAIERPVTPDEEVNNEEHIAEKMHGNQGSEGGGAFSKNPLLGGLIKPVFDLKEKGSDLKGRKDKKTRWRRVQDDLDDNEGVILDGGAYGTQAEVTQPGMGDEPACG